MAVCVKHYRGSVSLEYNRLRAREVYKPEKSDNIYVGGEFERLRHV